MYVITFLFLLFVFIILAESYDFIRGYAGYINLGHIAFFGIGAYVFGLLFKSGFSLPIAILIGGASATLFAAVISYPFFRLRGAYYCIATIGLVFFLYHLSLNLEIIGGVKGISIPVPVEIIMIPCYYAALGLALVTILISYKLEDSRFGLALISIREDEDTAEIFGIKTFKYKAMALMLSAFPAGIAGGIYACFMGYINPEAVFGLSIALSPVVMAFLGGSGNFLGPVVGALFLRLIQEIVGGRLCQLLESRMKDPA